MKTGSSQLAPSRFDELGISNEPILSSYKTQPPLSFSLMGVLTLHETLVYVRRAQARSQFPTKLPSTAHRSSVWASQSVS